MKLRIIIAYGVAALAAAVAPALAAEPTVAERKPAARAGARVLMDPATGTVRDPLPDEALRAREKGAAIDIPRADYSRMTQRMNADGSVRLDPNGQIRAYATVRVGTDGTLHPGCDIGGDSHDHAAHDAKDRR